MIRLLSLLLSTVILTRAEPQISFEKVVRYQDTVAGQRIELAISQGDYDFSKHKLTGGVPGASEPAKIDGVEVAGTDGVSPVHPDPNKAIFETVREIRLKWDGKVVEVPKSLHVNLLNLTLAGDFDWKTIQFVPNSAGNALLVQATGGDGGASYLVSLILRKNGNHQQIYHGYWEDDLPTEVEAWELIKAEQTGARQPATLSESDLEDGDNPQPESEGRSQ